MSVNVINKRLPLIQEADLNGKVVLVRFDHNVVKDGIIKDPFRIDKTLESKISPFTLNSDAGL